MKYSKIYIVLSIFALLMILSFKTFAFFGGEKTPLDFSASLKEITINDNGLVFEVTTNANTISDLFIEKNIKIGEHDAVIPDINANIYSGINIEIKRALKIKIQADGNTMSGYTMAKNIGDALAENKIVLSRLDKTEPDKNSLPQNNLTIIVTRINEEITTVSEDIPFKTITKTDNTLGWREKKVDTLGENGSQDVTYKTTYKNGKQISKVALNKVKTQDPVTEVDIQGTFVKVGKADKGQGTWYSYQGGMFAASLSIPRGGYARVTNTANGKSVMVQINDSGPYGKGRIIDLDKPAFQKIADLGAGVINVKVEEVLN